MKRWNVWISSLVFSVAVQSHVAKAVCIDLQLDIEAASFSNKGNDCNGGNCKATMVLRCMGGTSVIPGMALVQTFREKNGKLCYADLACGNVDSWAGSVGLSGQWIFYDSVVSFLTSQAGQQAVISANNNYHGRNTGVSVDMEWGQITRDCKAVSSEICL